MGSVIVIGGGAAGMTAAIAAAMCGDEVTVLERMDRVGKKLLATGNGRCNLMNMGELRYPGGSDLAASVLSVMGSNMQQRFWQHLGLRLRQEDGGRVYPISGAASTVLDTLRHAMRVHGVKVLTGIHVTDIRRNKRSWTVIAGEERFVADRIIAAGGGCAQPKLGSDGSLWPIMTRLGHTLVPARPALTQVMTDTAPIRGLSGIRLRTRLRITRGKEEKYAEAGELLFADYGVTGVCVMQCARYAAPGDTLYIDLARALGFDTPDDMLSELKRRKALWQNAQDMTALDFLTGLCVPKVAQCLLRAAGVEHPQTDSVRVLSDRILERIVHCAEDFKLEIRGVKGFENAQVTAGGLDVSDFNAGTLESRLCPGLHAAGEMLDVDGDCGGYNLMFAFGSGILAGLNNRPMPW